MKFLLVGINSKYIHSNPAIHYLKLYAGEEYQNTVELAEYTINHLKEQILSDIYSRRPDAIGISPRIGENVENAIYAVMKDGSRIQLNLTGNNDTVLQAETPIVLSQLDYILLEDGTKLFAPNI